MTKGMRRCFNHNLPKNRRERQDTIQRVEEDKVRRLDPPTKGGDKQMKDIESIIEPAISYIKITVEDKIKTTKELLEIYEEIVLGLAELPLGDDNGRRRIAGATQRIGKLLGLDKITKED